MLFAESENKNVLDELFGYNDNKLENFIDSERLSLNLVSVEWLDEIFEENRGNVKEYFVEFKEKSEVQTWINENRRLFEKGQKMEMVILNKKDNQFTGMVSLQNMAIQPEIGLWIKEEAQGQGYGSEAVQVISNWYKEKFGKDEKIKYLVETGNLRSINLAKGFGMEKIQNIKNYEGKEFEEYQF